MYLLNHEKYILCLKCHVDANNDSKTLYLRFTKKNRNIGIRIFKIRSERHRFNISTLKIRDIINKKGTKR